MNETRYMISDTAKKVEVEAHVLRYWEEELDLPIARNEMGHRYYTAKNVQLFKNIKELKEQGFQLKAIKILLPDLEKQEAGSMDNIIHLKDELNRRAFAEGIMGGHTNGGQADSEKQSTQDRKTDETGLLRTEEQELIYSAENDDKMQQFQMIISNIVTQVLRENNKVLGKEISDNVGDHVIKEMDYLMRMKEEREEERYKLLDETIRTYQLSRRQVAAAKADKKVKEAKPKKEKKPGFFRKFKKKDKEIQELV